MVKKCFSDLRKNSWRFMQIVLVSSIMLFFASPSYAQTVIKGTVTSAADGTPLVGVNVVESGNPTNGVVTDLDGKYKLTVKPGASVDFSFMGYLSQSHPAKSVLDVALQEDSKKLDEVVVVGYGTMKKSDLTGSVAKVADADLRNRATSDAAVALQGKAAGVQVLSNSGAPGKGSDIRIRGMSSNSGNNGPLLIVDGLKVDNIQYLDPEMIESMEILKDAASAAIYGAQAGNGVVLITTKNGAKSKSGQIFYNAQWQRSSLSRKLKVMDADKYIAFGKDRGFIKSDATLTDMGYNGENIDWADEVFEPTWNSRHTIGFQGSNESGSYFLALNHVKNNGIFTGDKDMYKRLSFQLNGDFKVKPWLSIGTNNSFEKWKTESVSQQSDNGSALLAAITTDPLFGPLCTDESQLTLKQQNALADGSAAVIANENGQYYRISPISGESQSSNPFIQRDRADNYSQGISIRGLAYLNFNPIKGLVYTSRFGYRIAQSNTHNYEFPFVANDFVKSDVYKISANANNSYYYQWENFVNFNKTFFDKHYVTAMAGMSWEEYHNDDVSVSSEGADILKGYEENFRYVSYLKDDAKKTVSNAPGESKNTSYFARLTYSYDNRYSVQGNFRADAFDSSKLPSDSRWGYFPSFSAGWTVSNESFVKDNIGENILSYLKLRGSWGRNGNINVLNNYQYATVINANNNWYQYTMDGKQTFGSVPNGLPNPNLEWEESEQLDFGLDARFLDSRLTLGIDWYKKTTKGLLVNVTPVVETGVGTTMLNAGEVENKGLEFELGWKDNVGDLHYSINGNFATLKNELTYLDPSVSGAEIKGSTLQGATLYTTCTVGQPLYYFKGYKFDRFDEKGAALYKDVNGDGVWDTKDMTNVGCGLPDVTYGVTINLEYKGFDFLLFGTGAAGFEITPQSWRTDREYCNTYEWYYDHSWSESNKNAGFPSAKNWTKDAFSSDLNVFNGNYFKIKQIQLGYTVPSNIVNKVRISNLRVFASLENFFTFTNYMGLDPETASANNGSSLGIDMGTYPTAKQIVFGVNVSF